MNILEESGKCKQCHKDASSEFMQCWLCANKYHVIGCDETDAMIQSSFFNSQWPTIKKKWLCITFTCPSCREDIKTRDETTMSSRVRLLEESSLKTNKQLEDILGHLTTVINNPPPNKEVINGLITTAMNNLPQSEEKLESVSDQEAKEAPTLIVVEKAENEEVQDTKKLFSEVTKGAIESKARVAKSFTNKAGQSVFVCRSEKSKQALLPHVEKVFHNRKINTPKPKLPTISVPFIVGQYEKEELLDVLKTQNEEKGIVFSKDTAQVLFTTEMKDREGMYQAVIRVSDNLRKKIADNDNRLCIGINSCPVFDRFFIKRCNRCQEFHHFQKDNGGCKKAKVCGLCTGNHDTRDCNTDEDMYKCNNCAKSGKDEFSHATFSHECPSYIEEQEKLKKSINYYSKNT